MNSKKNLLDKLKEKKAEMDDKKQLSNATKYPSPNPANIQSAKNALDNARKKSSVKAGQTDAGKQPAPNSSVMQRASTVLGEVRKKTSPKDEQEQTKKQSQQKRSLTPFEKAFATAKKANKESFDFKEKKYNTKTKDDLAFNKPKNKNNS